MRLGFGCACGLTALERVGEFGPVSAKLFNCVCFLLSRRGAGRGEGEPSRGRAHRQTEAPASPQRALPVPAVREPPRHPHQVGRGLLPLRPPACHTSCVSLPPPPPLSTSPGGSAAWRCWMRLNQCFHTLTKRWVRVEVMNRTIIDFLWLIIREKGGQGRT